MRNSFRLITLLITFLLSFGSTSEGYRIAVAQTEDKKPGGADAQESLTDSRHIKFEALHRSSDSVVSSVSTPSSPNLKNHSSDLFAGAFAFWLSLPSSGFLYLAYSRYIERGLSISDNIFPFHYFW
ncbi:hypothetical protein POKO110462_18670 [Pontibacter korlensis]|uniref:Uncharacterized protein n=1 Tax=Pontibacter korlensis TaxID=400092 RepID=A0A0E3ZGK9_9BACT|nr:hypothetical protein PKOR_20430 [Pontibacter korlensis]